MIASLSPADLVALGVLLLGFAAAFLFPLLHSGWDNRPSRRIRRRVLDLNPELHAAFAPTAPLEETTTAHLGPEHRWWMRRLRQIMLRIRTMGGRRLLLALTVAGIAIGLIAFVLTHSIFKLNGVLQALAPPAAAAAFVLVALPALEARRAQKFLDQFPDAVDYIIRSVRAGIPVGQAIRLAASEMGEPLGPEFRRIGDGLAVGIDLKEALDDAARRIAVPDFTFFAVCLVLQRETGGQLTATLENLSAIIRQRREIRLKAQAMTAEGRMSAKIIGSLPLFTMGALELVNPDYLEVLFVDDRGRQYLTIAASLLTAGMLVIKRMTNLRT